MHSYLRHITIWSLVCTLLFGQTGISLHRIYCFCKGEWEASLFPEESSVCSAHEEEVAHLLPACCQHNAECLVNETGPSHLPCSNDQVVYLQLDQPAVRTTLDYRNHTVEWNWVRVPPSFQESFPNNQQPDASKAHCRAPCLKAGRSIRIWMQSFLC
ncbi:MAG: hypothetical protein IPL49_07110 [Saprospirales bacterium]|nr:hypothetical protein [Saprospirales bacterium]MBK8490660.1 hypothetical protein [Saprospirales bacterium]